MRFISSFGATIPCRTKLISEPYSPPFPRHDRIEAPHRRERIAFSLALAFCAFEEIDELGFAAESLQHWIMAERGVIVREAAVTLAASPLTSALSLFGLDRLPRPCAHRAWVAAF